MGYYGKLCTKKCPHYCKDNYCFMNGNCAKCTSGFYGPQCNETCSSQCLECSNGTICGSCNIGFFGVTCSEQCGYCKDNTSCNINTGNCEQCTDKMYGSKCEFHNCISNCLNDSCNATSGLCDFGCKNGYWGNYCNNTCSSKCLNGVCNLENGTCSSGCIDDFHDYICDCPTNCICGKSEQCNGCSNNAFYWPLYDQN
jgi:hypothetical protein